MRACRRYSQAEEALNRWRCATSDYSLAPIWCDFPGTGELSSFYSEAVINLAARWRHHASPSNELEEGNEEKLIKRSKIYRRGGIRTRVPPVVTTRLLSRHASRTSIYGDYTTALLLGERKPQLGFPRLNCPYPRLNWPSLG